MTTVTDATKPVPKMDVSTLIRFMRYVKKTDKCWIWQGSFSGNATHKYGDFSIGYNRYRAHRLIYATHRGEIPKGAVIDHLCGNPACVNPDHLEPVSIQENTKRGRSFKTHCTRGHPLVGENLVIDCEGKKRCRDCASERQRIYRERKRGGRPTVREEIERDTVAKIVAYGFRYADAHAGKWSGMDQREAVKHFINQIEAGEYRNDA